MVHRRPSFRVWLLVALLTGLTSGCTSAPAGTPQDGHSSQGASLPVSDGAGATGPKTAAAGSADTADTSCDTPSKQLLDWAGVSIASHPGPIRGAALVHAGATDTGDWYVLALDREYVLDDDTPTGTGSRSVALTNAVDAVAGERKMIPLGDGEMGSRPLVTWDNVTWTGDTLAAGQRAAARALGCLDAASR